MSDKLLAWLQGFDYAALLANGVRIVVVLVVALIVWWVIKLVLRRLAARIVKRARERSEGVHGAEQRAETVLSLFTRVIAAFYWVAVILTLLSQAGVNVGALVAGAGIFGLALSFGAQGLVKDYISGFFIVLEGQISAGDIAIINGQWGTVEAIQLRTTLLRSMDGILHVYRNGTIGSISNATKGWGGYVFKLHIGYCENTDRVIDVVQGVGAAMKADAQIGRDIHDDMEIHGVNALTDSSVEIRGRFRTTPMNQWAVGREFLARIKRAFDAEGIQFAQPRQLVSFSDSDAFRGDLEPSE